VVKLIDSVFVSGFSFMFVLGIAVNGVCDVSVCVCVVLRGIDRSQLCSATL